MQKIILSFLALLLLAGCAARPVRAQYIGNVGLQTVTATLATNNACTGTAQTFVTGTTSGFNNIGQTRHIASVANIVNASQFQMEIDGIDNQGNVFRLSNVLELPGLSVTRQGSIQGTGYYPKIQVRITCAPIGATYTASYAGDFGTSNELSGTYLTAAIDHINFFGAASTSSQSDSFQTPYGSSGGTIYFQYAATGTTGAFLTITCNALGITQIIGEPLDVVLQNTASLQSFSVPAVSCPIMNVAYGNPGGSTTIATEIVFSVPGMNTQNLGNTFTTSQGVDPCASPNSFKQSQPINISTAATTSIIPPGALQAIYVCGGLISAGSGTVQLEYGTGLTCGTGTVALTGTLSTTNTNSFPGAMTSLFAPVSNRLCAVTVGGTVSVQGWITYVQQ